MNPGEFARLVVEVCALALPPGITTDRLADFAQVESSHTALVIGVNVPGGGSRRYATEGEAIAAAQALDAQGRDYDAGIMQINRRNWSWLGLTAETVFKPCPNIAAGIRILAQSDRAAACHYNTGRLDCRRPNGTNGYPERIEAAAARRALTPTTAAAATTQPPPPEQPWDVWARPTPAAASAPASDPEATPAGSTGSPRLIVELINKD